MSLVEQLKTAAKEALAHLYPDTDIPVSAITINQTKTEFTGDYTLVLFPFLKLLRTKPDIIGNALGEYLANHTEFVQSYEIVAGFLNLTVKDTYWNDFLVQHYNDTSYGTGTANRQNVMVEYSSPNTNKPLHFGHMRNIFLGYAMSEILKTSGNNVTKANLINDRGIHICKSMVAWQHFANGATPETSGVKGDHLVGDYYVKFNNALNEELAPMLDELYSKGTVPEYLSDKDKIRLQEHLTQLSSAKNDDAIKGLKSDIKVLMSNYTSIQKEAQQMLLAWEAGDEATVNLWKTMNGWVYDGFDVTYKRMGVDFDKMYYESNTYLLGKEIVLKGLEKGLLYRKEDNSVWVNLEDEGLDQKLLLRADGTSVYMTQDIGTAILKYNDCNLDKSIYVIGDEQNYHMQVLQLILKKLGEPCADGIYHLSYGMVELPTGRMKSREGTVVDADDMIADMVDLARKQTEEAGKTEGFTEDELKELYETIGLGALKFYLLRVDPKKKMIFNPEESIDLHGFTATFIQYAHARICSILRKENIAKVPDSSAFADYRLTQALTPAEKKLIVTLEQYPEVMQQAANDYNPSLLCNYIFQLAQQFNSFYDAHSIAKAENEEKKQLRLMIIVMTAQVMRHAMNTLGIRLPEKM
ncbi:MAG: arginine--tRNA ligase [Chitinophagaceae bacterium]|nr:arginine--tRNA ligase [Chitinophagaceae bacterium]MCB9045727.1 arginine--tRNA ligase [Chitinophagales bacterium]